MPHLKPWALVVLVAVALPVCGQSPAELVAQADGLFEEVWRTQYTISAAPELQAKLEAAIKLYELALTQDPGNIHVLNMLSRCYYTLADIFLPKDQKVATWATGQEYGLRGLRADPGFVQIERERGFIEAVRTSTDLAACFWTYSNWARKLEAQGILAQLWAVTTEKADVKLMALMERCLELDRGYISGGPLRALAGYWAKHPIPLTRDYEKARVLLEEAIVTYPEYLENHLFYVEYYLIPVEKWAQAREELQKVIDAPIGEDALENGYAKILALNLLSQIEGK